MENQKFENSEIEGKLRNIKNSLKILIENNFMSKKIILQLFAEVSQMQKAQDFRGR